MILRRAFPTTILVLCGLLAGLAIGEAGLRIAGFTYQVVPTVQFGWPEPQEMLEIYAPDRDLFWVPRDYSRLLAEARHDPPAIVFLGDSCTEFGTYAERTLARLRKLNSGLSTGLKMGVGGWSSVQGLAQLRRDVLPLRPRVITVYFGWNDHWVALGAPDTEARPGALSWWLSQHSRLFQLLLKVRLAARIRVDQERPNRVDLETYKANLRQMVSLSRGAGIRSVLITAPSNHQPGHEPTSLGERHLRRPEDLIPQHRAYVDATREVARETGAALCDAAESFGHASAEQRNGYFKKDGIHLTKGGDRFLAELLSGSIMKVLTTDGTTPGRASPREEASPTSKR